MFKVLAIYFLVAAAATNIVAQDCDKGKDGGNGKEELQKFYFNPKWHTCFGFKYTGNGGNGNRFNSYSECMSRCAGLDGSMCAGPIPSKSPLNEAHSCDTAKCPQGFECKYGTIAECCNIAQAKSADAAYSDKCPDGSKAGGSNDNGYFQATFGETCKDLVCKKDQKCVQVNKDFARCCGGK